MLGIEYWCFFFIWHASNFNLRKLLCGVGFFKYIQNASVLLCTWQGLSIWYPLYPSGLSVLPA